MIQATDSLATAHTTCNTADPIRALADSWGAIKEIDRAQREFDQGEKAAYEQKDRLEQAVLCLEPQTADDALSVLLVAVDELRHTLNAGALQSVIRWLIDGGATSPLLPIYADGRPCPKQPSV